MISMDMLVWIDDTVLRIFFVGLRLTLMTSLAIYLEEEADKHPEDSIQFLRIFLEADGDLEDREALIYYTKLLSPWKMCFMEKKWILTYQKT